MVYDLEKLEISAPEVPSLPPPSDTPEGASPAAFKGYTSPFHLQCVVSLFLLVAIFFIHLWWPQGKSVVKELLVADQIGSIEQAGQNLVREIFSGEPLPDAVAVFCREVLNALP